MLASKHFFSKLVEIIFTVTFGNSPILHLILRNFHITQYKNEENPYKNKKTLFYVKNKKVELVIVLFPDKKEQNRRARTSFSVQLGLEARRK